MFVDRLFKCLDAESYLKGEDTPGTPSPPASIPKGTPPPTSSLPKSTPAPASNRSDTSSPMFSSRRTSEDLRHREVCLAILQLPALHTLITERSKASNLDNSSLITDLHVHVGFVYICQAQVCTYVCTHVVGHAQECHAECRYLYIP